MTEWHLLRKEQSHLEKPENQKAATGEAADWLYIQTLVITLKTVSVLYGRLKGWLSFVMCWGVVFEGSGSGPGYTVALLGET